VVVEGIEKCRPVGRDDIEIGLGRVDHALEKGRSVHPLPIGQHGIGLFDGGHRDLQLLQLAVRRRYSER